jgi:DNA anti-recombination protein RmuC
MDKLDVLGKRLFDAQKEYDALITTRRRGLDRSLERIENLRAGSGPESAEEGNIFDGTDQGGTEGKAEDPS